MMEYVTGTAHNSVLCELQSFRVAVMMELITIKKMLKLHCQFLTDNCGKYNDKGLCSSKRNKKLKKASLLTNTDLANSEKSNSQINHLSQCNMMANSENPYTAVSYDIDDSDVSRRPLLENLLKNEPSQNAYKDFISETNRTNYQIKTEQQTTENISENVVCNEDFGCSNIASSVNHSSVDARTNLHSLDESKANTFLLLDSQCEAMDSDNDCDEGSELIPLQSDSKFPQHILDNGAPSCSKEVNILSNDTVTTFEKVDIQTHQYRFQSRCSEANLSNKSLREFNFKSKPYIKCKSNLSSSRKTAICKFCHKNCKSHHDLVRHERIHTGEKPFQCKICSKSFTRKFSLDCHLTVHTGERPFQCNVCCRKFSAKGSLLRHKRSLHK